jgi:NADH-quinone oxidoreductase subunit J
MLNLRRDEFDPDPLPGVRFLGTLAGGTLLAQLVVTFRGERAVAAQLYEGFGGVRDVGRALFSDYLLPFELTSVLLLAAVLAAVVLARRPAMKVTRQTQVPKLDVTRGVEKPSDGRGEE